jgi:hypothetical protein
MLSQSGRQQAAGVTGEPSITGLTWAGTVN